MKDSKKISLFIDSATKVLSIAVKYGEEYKVKDLGNPKKALENLNQGIHDLLCEFGLKLKDVDSFYCLLGPGSNTGIRLGLTIPRTIYAFNPNIKVYGIPTMELFTKVSPSAALSDRNGNLFFATTADGKCSYRRIDKDKIDEEIVKGSLIAIEKEDTMAKDELQNHDIIEVETIDLMIEYSDSFTDFSDNEEDYLPEYLLKI